jgi:hypothetical protein
MVAAATMAWLVGLVPGAFPLRVLAGVALFVLLAALLRIVGAEDLALGGRVMRDRGARGATP